MPKYFFKRILPSPDSLGKNRFLRPLLSKVTNIPIWQVNRHTVSLGVAIGLFFGALPIPMQMPAAASVAVLVRANVPAALMLTWWSNPLTFGPIFYFNYRIGAWIYRVWFDMPAQAVTVKYLNTQNLKDLSGQILMPLFSGSVAVGIALAVLGYLVIVVWWRLSLIQHHFRRRERYHKNEPRQ